MAPKTEAQVREIIARHAKEHGSMRALAREWGVTPSFISDLLGGRRAPGPSILKHLGLVRVVRVTYESPAKVEVER